MSTSDNLILMCLVLEHYNNNEDDAGLLLQVDFEKLSIASTTTFFSRQWKS